MGQLAVYSGLGQRHPDTTHHLTNDIMGEPRKAKHRFRS